MAESEQAVQKFSLSEHRKTLRKFRKHAGLTLQKLADLSGLSKSMLSLFETGKRDLSPEAMDRLKEVLTDVLSEKKAAQKLAALRESAPAKKLFPPEKFGRLSNLASLGTPEGIAEMFRYNDFLAHGQERIRLLEQLVEGYRKQCEADKKIIEISEQIIAMLEKTGPGSVAASPVALIEEVKRLRSENASLREWLNAEEVAALSQSKATELREHVNSLTVAGMQKENAEAKE